MNLESRIANGTFASLVLFILNIVNNIVLIPFFLTNWGVEKYGQWISILSLAALFRIFQEGHSTYIGNQFNLLVFRNKLKAKSIIGSGLRMSCLIYMTALLLFVILNYLGLFKTIYKSDIINQKDAIKGTFYLISIWGGSTMILSVLVKMLPAFGYYTASTYFACLRKTLEITIISLAIYFNLSLSDSALLLSISFVIYALIVVQYIRIKLPEFYPWWDIGSFNQGWINFIKSLVLTANSFITKLSTDGLIIIITTTLGSVFVPLYTTIRTLANTATQISALILNPLKPELIRYHATKEVTKVVEVVKTNWFIIGIFLNLSFIISLPLIEPLYIFWTKGKLIFEFKLYLLLQYSVLVLNFGQIFTTYLNGINNLKALFVITVSRTILIILGSTLLIPVYGLIGIGWAFLFSECVVSAYLPYHFFNNSVDVNHLAKSTVYSLSSIVYVGIIFILYYKLQHIIIIFIGIGSLYFSWLQYNDISNDVKTRITKMLQAKLNNIY